MREREVSFFFFVVAPKSETRLKQTQNKRHKAPSGPPSVSTWGRAGRQVERKEKEKRVTGSVTRMSVSLCLSAAFSANRAPFYFNGKDNRSAQQTVRERDKSSQQWLTTGTTRSSHRPTAAFSAKKKKKKSGRKKILLSTCTPPATKLLRWRERGRGPTRRRFT